MCRKLLNDSELVTSQPVVPWFAWRRVHVLEGQVKEEPFLARGLPLFVDVRTFVGVRCCELLDDCLDEANIHEHGVVALVFVHEIVPRWP